MTARKSLQNRCETLAAFFMTFLLARMTLGARPLAWLTA